METAKLIIEIFMTIITALAIITALFKERLTSKLKCTTVIGIGSDTNLNKSISGIKLHIVNLSCYPMEISCLEVRFMKDKRKMPELTLFEDDKEVYTKCTSIDLINTVEAFRSIDFVISCVEIDELFRCESVKKNKLMLTVVTPIKSFKIKTNYSGQDIINLNAKKKIHVIPDFDFMFEAAELKTFIRTID